MKVFVIIAMLTCFNSSFALDQNADQNGEQNTDRKSLNLDQFKGLDTESAKSGGIKFSVKCKTDDGRELKSTDSGYESCLEKARNKIKM